MKIKNNTLAPGCAPNCQYCAGKSRKKLIGLIAVVLFIGFVAAVVRG